MSLKAVHIFFILTASALAIGVGVWAWQQHEPVFWVVASFVCSALLDIYLVWFIGKSKNLSSR